MSEICKVFGCGRIHLAQGFCGKHYQRFRDAGGKTVISRHGMHDTGVYHRWEGINQRCHNPKHDQYPRYGGRGITVCAEWRHSFDTFYREMGPLPSPRHQIDRIDGSKGYCRENCRWVLPAENTRNRSATKLNPEKVLQIRALRSGGMRVMEIAGRMMVSRATIDRVLSRELWADVAV